MLCLSTVTVDMNIKKSAKLDVHTAGVHFMYTVYLHCIQIHCSYVCS